MTFREDSTKPEQIHTHPLKKERLARGWSQAKVAAEIGTTAKVISRWEQGHHTPTAHYRELLCLLFDKTAQELGLLQNEAEVFSESERAMSTSSSPSLPETRLSLFPVIDPSIPTALERDGKPLGRDELLDQLKDILITGHPFPSVALYGLPGVGKTVLALALTNDPEIRKHFPDGILWAGLGPKTNIIGQLARWGKLVGITATDVGNATSWEAWARALQATLEQRSVLLIIDDAWNSSDALAFQLGGERCAHVFTTRLPQVAFACASNHALAIPELADTDAIALLTRYIPQVVQQESERVHSLVQTVGGLPLALTLIGKYLAAQAFAGQPRRVQAGWNLLQDTQRRLQISMPRALHETTPYLPEETPFSLQSIIAISDQLLTAQAQTALYVLSLFPPKPDSFSEEVALAVTGEPESVLDLLWDSGLIESSLPGRYTIHQTIVDYMRTHLKKTELHKQFVTAMNNYLERHQEDYSLLEMEYHNIFVALDMAAEHQWWKEFLQGLQMLIPFLKTYGFHELMYRYLQQGIPNARSLADRETELILLADLANTSLHQGKLVEAEAYSQEGLKLAQQVKRREIEIRLLKTQGGTASLRGDYIQAEALHRLGIQLAREEGDLQGLSAALDALASNLSLQGKREYAIECFQEALALAQQVQNKLLICTIWKSLAITTHHLGNPGLAEHYLQEALALAYELRHRNLQSLILTSLGVIEMNQGKLVQAEKHFREGLALTRLTGHRRLTCSFLTNLGNIFETQGEYELADHYFIEGTEIAQRMNFPESRGIFLLSRGNIKRKQKEYSQAETLLREGLKVMYDIGVQEYIHQALIEWGRLHVDLSRFDVAIDAFSKVLTQQKDSSPYAEAQYGLACVAAQQGNFSEAHQRGKEALRVFQKIGYYEAENVQQWLQSLPQENSY